VLSGCLNSSLGSVILVLVSLNHPSILLQGRSMGLIRHAFLRLFFWCY
jgi:hypothetical protein